MWNYYLVEINVERFINLVIWGQSVRRQNYTNATFSAREDFKTVVYSESEQ